MASANQNQSPPPVGTAAAAADTGASNNDSQNHGQSFFVEAQGSLSPYPLQSKDHSASYPSPISNQDEEAQRTRYYSQHGTAASPLVSEPTWTTSGQQPLYMEPDAIRPAKLSPREAAEKRDNDILNNIGSEPQPIYGTYSHTPVQPDLSNRPAGMTPREAAEKREAAILGQTNSSKPPPVPAGHVVSLMALRQTPMPVDCPGCQRMVTTQVDKHVSEKGTMWSVVCCLCLGVFCFWIPLVMDEFKEYEHRCPNCRVVLAAIDSDGRVTHVYNQLPGPRPSNHAQPQYTQQQQQQAYPQPQQGQQKQEQGIVQERSMEVTNQNYAQEQVPTSPQEVPANEITQAPGDGGQPREVFELPASNGSKKSKKGIFGKKK